MLFEFNFATTDSNSLVVVYLLLLFSVLDCFDEMIFSLRALKIHASGTFL